MLLLLLHAMTIGVPQHQHDAEDAERAPKTWAPMRIISSS